MKLTESYVRQVIREEYQALVEEKKSAKDKMKCNSPRRIRKGEPGHGKKKFVVKACDGGKEKIIRYGDAGLKIKRSSPVVERISEPDTIVITQDQNLKLVIGLVKTGKKVRHCQE